MPSEPPSDLGEEKTGIFVGKKWENGGLIWLKIWENTGNNDMKKKKNQNLNEN